MKTILIPTDFSDNARNATEYALSLFGTESRYILLHAYSMPAHHSAAMLIDLNDELAKEANRSLRVELEKIRTLVNNEEFKIEPRAESGKLTTCVNHLCSKEAVDYVVMGTKGASGLEAVFIGSGTYEVVAECPRPIIIVPENAQFSGLKTVVYTADYDSTFVPQNDEDIINLVESRDASFKILHIDKAGDSGTEDSPKVSQLSERFGSLNPEFHTKSSENIEQGINDFIQANNTDMVVMIAHESSFFDTLFRLSTTRSIALHTTIPAMVLNDRK